MEDQNLQQLQYSNQINFSAHPPCIIAWFIVAIDHICIHLGCSNWRNILPEKSTVEGSWFSNEQKLIKSPSELMPRLMTYQEYLEIQIDVEINMYTDIDHIEPYSFTSMKQFAFHTSSTNLGAINSWTSLLASIVLVIIFRTIKANFIPMFSNFARTVGRQAHGKQWEKQKLNQIRINKFGEYVFRLCFHSIISGVGIYLFFDKPWWSSVSHFFPLMGNSGSGSGSGSGSTTGKEKTILGTKSLYINWPFQPIEAGMAWYYLVQAAYNVEAMISLLEMSVLVKVQPIRVVNDGDPKSNDGSHKQQWQLPLTYDWSESCRGDFREMFIHHIFTNLLIIGSSYFRFSYIGSMVFMIHDISDIPVDLSKLANFLKWKRTTAACFLIMCITWVITRLIILPFIVWKSMIYDTWLVCADGYIPPIYYNMYQPVFVGLLGFLILLHFFWFTLFIRMGYVLIRKGEAHDFSDHKKGEQYSQQLGTKIDNSNNNNSSGNINGDTVVNRSSNNNKKNN
mmetsp:Transcript_48748/g.54553  ORF Transcript_48748/g.54553 Transcript_48748/m.54553 type:complete len:509 (-) Transcript_48748:53-1579(-)